VLKSKVHQMAKVKKPGDSNTPRGSSGGPPGKKQRAKARKHSKGRRNAS
jgi:hypothetical protein